jgi:capsular polysaccharide transport system permease protein
MAYAFIGVALASFDLFPVPADLGVLLLGYAYYAIFTLAVCFVLTPLSEVSEVVEKLIPVTTYIMVPFSGTFYLMSWVPPSARAVLYYSPPVHAMEMMRYGLFGHSMTPHYDLLYPLAVSLLAMAVGLMLCRRVRRNLVIE